MNVNVKYLKDESGNVISPVTYASSVYLQEGDTMESRISDHDTYSIYSNISANVNNSISYSSLTDNGINYLSFECRIGSSSEEYTYFTTGKYKVRLGKNIEIAQCCGFGASGLYIYCAHYILNDTQLSYNSGHLCYLYLDGTNKSFNLDLNTSNIAIINILGYKYWNL